MAEMPERPGCAHHCHAIGCDAHCPPGRLMCQRHWRMVHPHFQRAVFRAWDGRCEGKGPSRPWLLAAWGAVYSAACREGTLTPAECLRRYEELSHRLVANDRAGLSFVQALIEEDGRG